MINNANLIRKNIVILLVFAVISVFLNKIELAVGVFLGMAMTNANFMFLQASISKMFSAQNGGLSKQLKSYLFRFLAKIALLSLLIIIFMKYLKINWAGFLAGMMLSSFIYITEILRLRKCLSLPKQ